MPNAASAYGPIMDDKKFSEICYLLICGVTAFLQQVHSACYHVSVR